MPPCHLDTNKRYCDAATTATSTKTFINNLKVALEGDKDDHNSAGDLISRSSGTIYVEGKKLIVAMLDKAAPDSQGGIQHPFAPTDPKEGSSNTFAYDGNAGGGLGNILGGNLRIGELVKIGGQLIGMVKNFTNNGNGTGNVVLQNMGASTPQSGQTLVGDESGNSLTIINFLRSDIYDRVDTAPDYMPTMNVAITDDFGVIAMPEHFDGSPSQDYQSDYIVITGDLPHIANTHYFLAINVDTFIITTNNELILVREE